MPSSTGGGGVEKNVAIVYTIEGVDQAAADQDRLAGALGETSEALGDAAEATTRAEQATERLGTASLEAGQQAILTQQRISSLAAGLSGLGAALGSDTEVGSVLGRMGQLAATGISIGSIFGPGGAVVGGILGAALPALQSLAEHMGLLETAEQAAQDAAALHADEIARVGNNAQTAAQQIAGYRSAIAARDAQEMARRIQTGEVTTAEEARLAAERTRQLLAPETAQSGADAMAARLRGASRDISQEPIAADAMAALRAFARDATVTEAEVERLEALADTLNRRSRGGGGRREREFRSDDGAALRSLLSQGESDDARSGRMLIHDVDTMAGQERSRRAGLRGRPPQDKAQDESLDRLADKQKEYHDAQLARIQEQVDAWAGAGQKIGSTLYNAFQIAATGQEDLDVAMVKGFKGLAIQFGGQMVNEGIGALFTAVGNTVANPPMAATKAAEGAGKLALGIGLAAGAAIPVPSGGGGSQASTPRLGPQGSGDGGGARSVVVNMNAPSVVTGTRAMVGREIGRALTDADLRFGRRASL